MSTSSPARLRPLLWPPALLALSACAYFFEAPPPPPPPAPPVPKRDFIAEVRAVAEENPSVVEVLALETPSVTHLIDDALAAEERRSYVAARRAVAVARQIEPDNPRVLQFLAEYALREGNWADAEQLAERAFQGSAQLGALCIRNQMTISLARAERGDAEGAAAARLRADECAQKALPRF
ncbi:MAG: hypothetical protein MUE46_19040 [Xanthomonadales bacterium]|jgi:hypothetical protein|nr:hypothetical protein [Xanthomonadales bacterium]